MGMNKMRHKRENLAGLRNIYGYAFVAKLVGPPNIATVSITIKLDSSADDANYPFSH